jgi:hypothetical protein
MNVESAAHASIFVTTSMHSCFRNADAGASIGGGAARAWRQQPVMQAGAGGVLDEPEPT